MSYDQKRKRITSDQPEFHWLAAHHVPQSHDARTQMLCVEAYEADLVPGKDVLALALEASESDPVLPNSDVSSPSRGSALIKWDAGKQSCWVDRFDARLLLSELPTCCSAQDGSEVQPGSPQLSSGWSDLPSDTEDAFFLSPLEIENVRRTKRRRVLEDARDQRLAALRAAGDSNDNSEERNDEDIWGGSDEEPDAMQLALMERTAIHLHTSPDRAKLAARILANHGADKRFAFMRGRWRRAWVRAQARAATAAAKEEEDKKKAKGLELMGLGAYGDTDEEESEEEKPPDVTNNEDAADAAKMEARRARAREWAAKRRAEKEGAVEVPSR
ncbi:uncharacterized protein FOMMEDRAFT_30403 [Fomitiporia mediterranea MF3/22]|uniref:uncharacterized protein n=1 Tax=Fomitiporia mediterranea (strain MF3/22) TaxID=694068 RepID=UPI0004409652|nr:uncharacterized protein FOMMEDRAFT_30403 [Fomitiporia mediterranea MF3/22]EJD00321.1 hypothetical protein FOMMEDRAFT_30403 [Fomitiporia mediterranea MF3/22]